MTERVLLDGRVVIVDDALDRPALQRVQQAIERTVFRQVDPNSGRIWRRNLPLNPDIGDRIVWQDRSHGALDSQASPPASFAKENSTALESTVDSHFQFETIFSVALAAARRHRLFERASVVDPYGGAVAAPYRYTAGTRLVWHTDSDYLGAFVAYLSPDWTENGGGWLAVQDGGAGAAADLARIIEPRYNRVVIFAGVRHSVLSVANDVITPRYSLSGFFVTTEQMRLLRAARVLDECRLRPPVAVGERSTPE